MTYLSPRNTLLPATTTAMRSPLSPLSGSLAHLRTALSDKQALIVRIEAEWVAEAERETARHISKNVAIDDRSTWDGATFARYLQEAERIEPSFKPRLRRLLVEVDAIERLLSPSAVPVRRAA